MSVDKLVDSTQLNTDLTSVANAIRAKSGGSSQLAFPNGFVSEIGNIPSGGTVTADDVIIGNILSGDVEITLDININTDAYNPIRYYGNITSINAPDLLNSGNSSNAWFRYCTKMESVNLGSMETIANNMFANCSKLKLVDLGAATRINNSAFYFCSLLDTVIIRTNSVCALPNGTVSFYNSPIRKGQGKVYVPQALITNYQQATAWSECYANGTQFLAIEGSIYE